MQARDINVHCHEMCRETTDQVVIRSAGKSQLQTGHVPRGIVGEFDIMTCRDLGNGEVQYFRIRYG
jgi:hypothetical protein